MKPLYEKPFFWNQKRTPPDLLYHGTSLDFFEKYYKNYNKMIKLYNPLLLTSNINDAITTAIHKGSIDESSALVISIDTKKMGTLVRFDNVWKASRIPLGTFNFYFFETNFQHYDKTLPEIKKSIRTFGNDVKCRSKYDIKQINTLLMCLDL
jgi:hypothetical protein